MSSLLGQIKANKSKIYRRLYVKRRDATTGLFETNWTEISKDVVKWGKLKTTIDEKQYNKFKFSGVRVELANDSGRYNPEANPSSLWFGYLSPQRSLVRVEAGFVHETMSSAGIWTRTEYPNENILKRKDEYAFGAAGTGPQTTTSQWAFEFTSSTQNLILPNMRVALWRGDTSVTGYALIHIYQGTSVTGGTLIQTSDSIPVVDFTTSVSGMSLGSFPLINFSTTPELEANKNHFWVLDYSNVVFDYSGFNYIFAGTSTVDHGGSYWSNDNGATYSISSAFNFSHELNFYYNSAASAFTGFISGDMPTSGKNIVNVQVQPLLDIFRQYPARLLDGWTSTGLTASQFVESVRDHTDGSGSHVFLPFFGDTITGFDIQSTTIQYGFLNTTGAKDIINSNVWTLIEKLAQAETFVPYVTREGTFRFVDRSAATSTTFEFHGAKSKDREFGLTIKDIKKFGVKYSKYYSRVDVRWSEADTETSLATAESQFQVTGTNLPWTFGHKTLKQDLLFIQDQSTAAQVADTMFADVSALRNEIEFDASFVPQLEILDRVNLTYNNSVFVESSLWDLRDWAFESEQVTTLDYALTSGGGWFAINEAYRHGGTFTPTTAGLAYVESISFPMGITVQVTTGGNLFIEIFDESSSAPGSIVATSELVDISILPLNTATSNIEFTFANSGELTIGDRYFGIINFNDAGGNRYKTANSDDTTTGELFIQSSNSGTSYVTGVQVPLMNVIMNNGPDPGDSNTLIWDEQSGDALKIQDEEFKLLKIELDLDKLSTKITARDAQ